MKNPSYFALFFFLAALLFPPLSAAEEERLGRMTGFPIPRYVSLKSGEANLRRGPGDEYPIDWFYTQKGWPLKITAEIDNWRKIEDAYGTIGWFHIGLIGGKRTAVTIVEQSNLHEDPSESSMLVAFIKKDVVMNLLECQPDWCLVEVDGYEGWLQKASIWGVDADEIFEQ